MAKNFYGVRKGRKTGIFNNWADCQKSIVGYPGAEFKGFMFKEEALAYVSGENPFQPIQTQSSSPEHQQTDASIEPYAFVDGSFNSCTDTYGYGGFLMSNGEKYVLQGSGNDSEMADMRNVAGEILGSTAAVEKALSLGLKTLTIYFDYNGIEKWATGQWKRNKAGTIAYHDFMQEKQKMITIKFVKVKGHAGIAGNEEADHLAKEAAGII